jgi:type II secretory ATPase GspE/PulE/Tfp pilus assembly ATPase PilB-like protein
MATLSLEREALRVAGGRLRKERLVYYDTIARVDALASHGVRRVHLTLRDGEPLRVTAASSDEAARVHTALRAILSRRAAEPARVTLPEIAARVDALCGGPGFSPHEVLRFLVAQASDHEASDIHLPPPDAEGVSRVELRRHGTLLPVARLSAEDARRMIACLKNEAGLLSYREDIPQEGRASFKGAGGRDLDLRVSVLPAVRGEKANLRLFQGLSRLLSLDELGLGLATRAAYDDLLASSAGLIVIAGPSGAGKTTTLYASLARVRERSGDRRRIATVEDPVEHELPGALQVPVNRREGVSHARLIQYLLRQDVDALAVGEVRDAETAAAAVEAALTGHLVLTTLHCRDASEALARLRDLGVAPGLLASSLKAILAQRLVRTPCGACAEDDTQGGTGEGACPLCLGTGYAGRTAVAELLRVDDALRDAVLDGRPTPDVMALARGQGMITLADDARARAERGETTQEEVQACLG